MNVTANTWKDYLKKYWYVFGMVILGFVFVCWRIVVSRNSEATKEAEAIGSAKQTKKTLETIYEEATEKLNTHTKEMEDRQKELDRINKIKDEEKRLQELADFANHRGGR